MRVAIRVDGVSHLFHVTESVTRIEHELKKANAAGYTHIRLTTDRGQPVLVSVKRLLSAIEVD
jgi:hypothetical protein